MMNKRLLAMALCSVLLLAGCNEPDMSVAAASGAIPEATVLSVGSGNSVSAKPGLPVTLLKPRQGVEVGVVTRVDLSLTTGLSKGRFEVGVTPSAGVTVVAGELQKTLIIDDTDGLSMGLDIRVDQPGKYYINIEVTSIEQVGGLDRRALAAVVVAGGEDFKMSSTELKSKSEKHVMPAQERVY